ncbi:Phosphatidylinositol transfer protein [Aphelenchoides besseyi]|nr:Phosphatidylinositol transfer protein [Aphelenchoides besseyi]KAI6236004.1 Phosphatidylinositol transfer protein [Aphelenchoides besseyi]
MIIKEYRVVLPMSVEEYQVGQLFSVAEASKNETGGGEGVEVLKNEPFNNFPLLNGAFDSGQYTHKIYHLQSKVPALLRKVAPRGSLAIHEKAWNAYPYCRTELSNPDYMGDNFFVRIETMHLNDRGTTANAHSLKPDVLAKRDVVNINIANDNEFLNREDVKPETSPRTFYSERTGRGRLDPATWRQDCEPVMCAYKLVTVYFKWFGLQNMVESFAHKQYPRLFSKFHREVFCWIDRWYGLTMADIRELERLAQQELDEARKSGTVRGMVA